MKKHFFALLFTILQANILCCSEQYSMAQLIIQKVTNATSALPYLFIQLLSPINHDLLETPHQELLDKLKQKRSY